MESDGAQERIVTFQLGKETYGVPIGYVESIERRGALTSIPSMPDFFVGVFVLRGESVPVIDLRIRLGIEQESNDDSASQYIIITKIGGHPVGLLVDTVREVISADSGWLETEIALITGLPESSYLQGVMNLRSGGFVILLNLHALFTPEDQQSLTNNRV